MNVTIDIGDKREYNTLGRSLLIFLALRAGITVSPKGKLSQVYYEAAKQLDSIDDGTLIKFFEAWQDNSNITIGEKQMGITHEENL